MHEAKEINKRKKSYIKRKESKVRKLERNNLEGKDKEAKINEELTEVKKEEK